MDYKVAAVAVATTCAVTVAYFGCTEHGYLAWRNGRSVGRKRGGHWDWTVFRKSLLHGDTAWELLRHEAKAEECKQYFDKYPELLNDMSWWYLYSHRHPWVSLWRLHTGLIRDSCEFPHLFGGVTPIYWAIERKNNVMVEYLVKRGVNLADFDPQIETVDDCKWKFNLVECALRKQNWPALALLLDAQAPCPAGTNRADLVRVSTDVSQR
jgi:hypothetical protein